MGYTTEIIKFIRTTYKPDDENILGYLSIRCLIREFGTRERERSYTFQYDSINGKVFFLVYPTLVQLPISDAKNVEEATEQAKGFLTKWIGDIDIQFKLRTAQEIRRLEEEKKKEREQYNKENMEENKKKLLDALKNHRKKSGNG